jgi:hypothetical protein
MLREEIVAKAIISLDEQQVTRLEQIIIDREIEDAWDLLIEIRKKVRASLDSGCGVDKLRKGL